MFTGIIEEIGTVLSLEEKLQKLWNGGEEMGVELTISASLVLEGTILGASIAVNGTCLTVTELSPDSFKVGLAGETLRRTNLGDLKVGDPVNLERGLQAGARTDGHFVQGHVDGTGVILEKTPDGDSIWIKIQTSAEIMKYIVEKGFIAVDGTSLTVCHVNLDESWFDFMMIPYTQKKVITASKSVGSKVNLEPDVLAKYVERSVGGLSDRVSKMETVFADSLKSIMERLDKLESNRNC
eukprot:GILJ01006390.1.p1 GENE.GILJ01006390.1~~GILJ01006390.1.p1  ORF type:complete len:239 (-),score=38.82 GILJ01006390.1:90-806(-)